MYFENFITHIPFIGNVYGARNGNLLEIVLANTQPAKNYFVNNLQEKFNMEQMFCEYMFCKFLTMNKYSVKYWIEQTFGNICSRLENFSINVNECENVYLCIPMNDYAL